MGAHCTLHTSDHGQMFRYTEKQSGRVTLTQSLVEMIEVGNGSGPIRMVLNNLPHVSVNDGYLKITDTSGDIVNWDENYGPWSPWSELNGKTYISNTYRVRVEFKPAPSFSFFADSYLEWETVSGGYDTDPDQFCDCC